MTEKRKYLLTSLAILVYPFALFLAIEWSKPFGVFPAIVAMLGVPGFLAYTWTEDASGWGFYFYVLGNLILLGFTAVIAFLLGW